jgi:hypothetical protein
MGPVARLDPGASERLVVEDAEVGQALDRAMDEFCGVARSHEMSARLVDRSRPSLEIACRRLEDDGGIGDLGAA